MRRRRASGSIRIAGLVVFLTTISPAVLQEAYEFDLSGSQLNCTTTDNYGNFHPTNAGHMDEPKGLQRQQTKENYYDNQHLNRHFSDERAGRYPDDENSSRDLDASLNRYLDDENRDLSVRPLNNFENNQESSLNRDLPKGPPASKFEDDRELNKYPTDSERNRNIEDDSYLNKYPTDIQKNRNDEYANKQTENQRYINRTFNNKEVIRSKEINRNLNEEYFRNRETDKDSNRNFNDRQILRGFEDSYIKKKLENKNANKNVEQRVNKDLDNKQPLRIFDGEHKNVGDEHFNRDNGDENLNRPKTDQYPNRNLDEAIPYSHLDNIRPDGRFKDQNFERRLVDQHHDGRVGDHDFEKHPYDKIDYDQSSSISRAEKPDFEKKSDELTPDRHLNEPYLNRNSGSDKLLSNPNFERKLEDPNFERHVEDKPLGNPNFERRLEDQNLERRTESNPLGSPNFERRLEDPNIRRHFEDKPLVNPIERRLEDPNRAESPNFEKHLLEPKPNKHLDDLIPNRRLDEQQPEKDGSDNVHPDRRLSKEDFIFKHYPEPNRNNQNQYINRDPTDYPKVRFNNPYTQIPIDDTTIAPQKESNVSQLMTFNLPKDWEEMKPKLNFPNKTGNERFKMATLHLDKGLFIFGFLRSVLSVIQPRNVPLDLLKDTVEGKVNISTLITQSLHLEMAFIGVISFLVVLMFVVPGTELWLCCRRSRYNYQRRRHGTLIFFLATFCVIMGTCVVTMLICNEEVAGGIDRIPETTEAALQDLRDYHSGTAVQLRRCLTRSLDVASEAILADLDSVEELLGKPVQAQLSSETGVDVALEELMDVANASTELAYKTDGLLKRADRARELGGELGREADELRRELERTARDCAPEDRSLCAVLDPSGLHLALRLERVARDDRLLRLRAAGRENLTEAGRQARGEYLYVPHHVARTTLEARNLIRREINAARAKVSDEARSIEASGSDLSTQLDTARRITGQVLPYVRAFEYARWFVGFGAAMCVLLVWLLLFGALCCRCGSSEERVRPTLLWFAFLSCIVSMVLWLVLIAALTLASHLEMVLCRAFDDPEYRTVEAVLETRVFLGRRLSVPLKDLFDKCEENGAVDSAFQLDNSLKLEQLTAHWTWTGLTRAFSRVNVDLTGLRILSPNLRERLQNLLYASGANLTEHRIMIQGPILNKDLNALSDQVENVARQLTDRRTARSFQTIAAQMRDLLSRRVKPLMKMQDELVYQLASLDLLVQPLHRRVNQSLSHLRSVQYFIDNQGEKIGQLKAKAYRDRMGSYLDQWRAHVLTDMSSGVAKCRPLWDVLQGIKLLLCSHILGPLNGYWFATLICVVTMLICTPSAHKLASSYWRQPSHKGSVLLPSRQGSPDTVVMARETWRTPDPPPSMDSW